jgi:transcriptional regulator with XRE-family HTH domain
MEQTLEKIYGINKKELGQTIKFIRLLRGLTQAKFAKLIKKSESYVGWLETAGRNLTIPMLQVVAVNLRVKATVLLYLSAGEETKTKFKEIVSSFFDLESDIKTSFSVDELALFELMKTQQNN